MGGASGILLIGVLVATVAGSRRAISVPPAARPLVAIILVSVVGVAQARYTLDGAAGAEPVSELIRLLALLAMYLMAASLFGTLSKARTLFLVVAVSALVPTVFGLIELANGPVTRE